jgi:hypothetical protein
MMQTMALRRGRKTSPDNQARSTIILQRRDMSSRCHSQRSGDGIPWIHGFLGVTALLALLLARGVPPQFAGPANLASIQALSSHDQRPRFNYDGPKWGLPAGSFQPLQHAASFRQIAPEYPSFSSLQATGLHYNRPPPAVYLVRTTS